MKTVLTPLESLESYPNPPTDVFLWKKTNTHNLEQRSSSERHGTIC